MMRTAATAFQFAGTVLAALVLAGPAWAQFFDAIRNPPPAADTPPSETLPSDAPPTVTQPADPPPTDTPPAVTRPADPPPADTPPAVTQPPDPPSADTPPAVTQPPDPIPTETPQPDPTPPDPTPPDAPPPGPEPVVAPPSDAPPPDAPSDAEQLAECRLSGQRLALEVLRLRQSGAACPPPIDGVTPDMPERLDTCLLENTALAEANIALGEELTACESGPVDGPDPAELAAELAEAREQVRVLTERLEMLGYSLEPGFGYVGGNASGSFVPLNLADWLIDGLSRLTEADCGTALDWLEQQAGEDLPLVPVIWVWGADGSPLLCDRNDDGLPQTYEPRPSDEAHVVVFQ